MYISPLKTVTCVENNGEEDVLIIRTHLLKYACYHGECNFTYETEHTEGHPDTETLYAYGAQDHGQCIFEI